MDEIAHQHYVMPMIKRERYRSVLRFGTVCILTACGGVAAEDPIVMVSDCRVARVTVTPASVTMHPRDTTILHGSGTATCLGLLVTVGWRLTDSTIVTITSSTDSTATIVALSGGSTSVIATAVQDPDVKGGATVSVVP